MAKLGADVWAVFGTALGLMALAILIDSEAIGWLVAPIVLVLIIVTMTKVPLRTSLMALMFCALTLENPAEIFAYGLWKSPLHVVGGLLLNHINTVTGVKPLFMSGMDILLVSLGIIAFQRESRRAKIDRANRVPTPRPLIRLALVSLCGTAFVLVSGVVRGGDMGMSLWQMDRVLYLPIIFLLFHLGLRGPADHVALGKVVILAATIRSIAAIYIIHTVYTPPDDNGIIQILPYATTHHDSVLFATGLVVLLAIAFTRVSKKAMKLVFLLMPVLLLGMVSNHRRMVWVQASLVPIALYVLTPVNAIKRKIQRIALIITPFIAVYCVAGWNSESGVFKPVKILRSVVDSKSDNSTLWRDIENFDLIDTIRSNPIFGTGYGHEYNEVVALPAVDYPLEKFLPHNSVLGMFSYSGYIGFAAMTLLWVVGAFFAMRAYYAAKTPIDRAAAISCFGVVLVYLIQCWGDLGLGAPTGIWLVAPALATAGKLAVATGAWPDKTYEPAKREAPVGPQPRVDVRAA